MYDEEFRGRCPLPVQRHVHETTGSTYVSESCQSAHNHRFSLVVGTAISSGGKHIHEVNLRTDFYEDHYHEYSGRTSPGITVGDRHVHFIKDCTDRKNSHMHNFRVATSIENPIKE